MNLRVAVIGSFKSHYQRILETLQRLRDADVFVTTPHGSAIIEEGVDFVRFQTDNQNWTDAYIQTDTLKRILGSSMVYVVAPQGYVGRTTCYEIGRVIQASVPIYFSERPRDLPISIPDTHIIGSEELVPFVLSGAFYSLVLGDDAEHRELEMSLLHGRHPND